MRPLLVGESNPYQSNPRMAQHFALYPDPPNCAGWNLCHKVMQLEEDEYLRRFDRVNLCDGKWNMKEARSRVGRLMLEYRTFVLCGSKVCNAVGIPFEPFSAHRQNIDGLGPETVTYTMVVLPHPSGLSRLWNEPNAFERARVLLREAGVLPVSVRCHQCERQTLLIPAGNFLRCDHCGHLQPRPGHTAQRVP